MDVYKIGVSLVLANGVSSVLAVVTKDLLKFHGSVDEVTRAFESWGPKLIGVGGILGGAAILGVMTELAKKAADFQDAMTAVSQLNPAVAALVQSGEIKRQSFDIGTKLGMKVEDVTKIYGGIYGAIQDPAESEELLPYAAKYARLMQMRHPGSHPEESIRTLVKAGELAGRLYDDKGNIDPAKVKEWFDMAAIAEAATHGQVNAETLYGMAQQAGPGSLRGLSKEGYEHMMILSQEMGGGRAGTSLLSLRQQMTGVMFKRSAEAMQRYGVLKDGEWSSEGGHVSMTDAAKDRLLGALKKDPVKFVDGLIKALEAKGITDKDKQMEAVTEMIGRQTSQRFVQDIIAQRQQIDRETKGLDQGATVEQGLAGYDGNIHAAQQNLSAAWHNLVVAIGGPEAERFATFLNRITSAINSVTAKVNSLSPEQIDQIFKVFTGIAIGFAAIGASVLIAMAGLPGIIFGVVAGLAALVALDLGDKNIFGGLSTKLIEALKTEFGNLSFTGVFAGIGTKIYQTLKDEVWTEIQAFGRDLKHLGADGEKGTSPGKTGKPWHPTGQDPASPGKTGKPWHPTGQDPASPGKPGEPTFYDKLRGMFGNPGNVPGSGNPMGDALKSPTSFDPGTSGPKHQQFAFALNIDGDRLAQTVIDKFDSQTKYPASAASANRSSLWAAGGDHYSDYT